MDRNRADASAGRSFATLLTIRVSALPGKGGFTKRVGDPLTRAQQAVVSKVTGSLGLTS
jgi:hypothetical protein